MISFCLVKMRTAADFLMAANSLTLFSLELGFIFPLPLSVWVVTALKNRGRRLDTGRIPRSGLRRLFPLPWFPWDACSGEANLHIRSLIILRLRN